MKLINLYILLILTIFFVQCEKDKIVTDYPIVKIITNKSTYEMNEKILVEVKNVSTDTLLIHYICRGSNYCVIDKIGTIENNDWVIEDNINLCFWIVLSDYWGEFSPDQILNDEISFQESGKYKLIGSFIINNDTVRISSNEFTIQ